MKKPNPKVTPKAKPKAKKKPAPKPKPKLPPLTPRQEKFAQLAAGGMLVKDAARKAGYSPGSARSLNRSAAVRERIAALRGKVEARGEELALLTIAKKRRFLAELVLTPVAMVGADSWLAQEWERVEVPGRGSNSSKGGGSNRTPAPTVRLKVKLADKLRAIELDSKLANHFAVTEEPSPSAGGTDERATAEALRAIAERVRKVLPVMWGAGTNGTYLRSFS